jgi:DNA polymerase III sliding clamp (beta) subunit (PCNA family)
MASILIPSTALRAILPFVSDDPSRPSLSGILLERCRLTGKALLVATDGHALCAVRLPDQPAPSTPCVLPGARVLALVKAAPRGRNAAIFTFEDETQTLSGLGLSCAVLPADGFPQWRRAVPARTQGRDVRANAGQIACSINLLCRLEGLGAYVEKDAAVTLRTSDPIDPIRFDIGEHVFGVIMPMRLSGRDHDALPAPDFVSEECARAPAAVP